MAALSQPTRRHNKGRLRCFFKSRKSIAISVLLLYTMLQFALIYIYYLRHKVPTHIHHPVTILGMEDVWHTNRLPVTINNETASAELRHYNYVRQRQNNQTVTTVTNSHMEKTNVSLTKINNTSEDGHTHDNNSSSSLRPHPHMGARDANGTWGYVADVYAVRRRLRQLSSAAASTASYLSSDGIIDRFLPLTTEERDGHVCGLPLGKGDEFRSGPLLIDKIVVGGADPTVPPVEERHPTERFDESKAHLARTGEPPRLLCMVYTHEANHERIRAIGETWGHRCDGFLAASTKTVPEIGAVDIAHEGDENYANMWQKTRSTWAYVHDNYLNDFDFFHLGGDDMHLIVENMRYYLWGVMSSSSSAGGGGEGNKRNHTNDDRDDYPLYLGMRVPQGPRTIILRPPKTVTASAHRRRLVASSAPKKKRKKKKRRKRYYLSGAPGYTLNRRALSLFVTDVLPWCYEHARVPYEDRFFSDCMESINVSGNDTTDARNEQRYLHIPPMFAYKGPRFNDGYNNMILDYWQRLRGGGRKRHMEAVSSQAVAMHWFKGGEKMKRHHAILYRSCPNGTALADSIIEG